MLVIFKCLDTDDILALRLLNKNDMTSCNSLANLIKDEMSLKVKVREATLVSVIFKIREKDN